MFRRFDIVKLNYNPTHETLDIVYSCSTKNVSPTRDTYTESFRTDFEGYYGYYANTHYKKLMSALMNMLGYDYSLHTTVEKKYRDAYHIAYAAYFDTAGTPNRKDIQSEEYFRLFIDTIDGKHKVTPGRFMLTTTVDGEITYWKDRWVDTNKAEKARIFKSIEEAKVTAHYYKYEIVEVN